MFYYILHHVSTASTPGDLSSGEIELLGEGVSHHDSKIGDKINNLQHLIEERESIEFSSTVKCTLAQ